MEQVADQEGTAYAGYGNAGRMEEGSWTAATELGALGKVFGQDMGKLPHLQDGLEASKTTEVNPADYQEIRIRPFHRTLDKYCAEF